MGRAKLEAVMEKLDGNLQDMMPVEKGRDECCPSSMRRTLRFTSEETMASQR